uniref:Uncharacterized protein n=1 Tax=Oryza brachyantha TaxID=4533 RepID=J3KVH8_ORYBR
MQPNPLELDDVFISSNESDCHQSIDPRLVIFLQRRRPPPPAQHGAHPRQPHHRVHPGHPLQSSPHVVRPIIRLAAGAASQDLAEAARERHGLRLAVPRRALLRRR